MKGEHRGGKAFVNGLFIAVLGLGQMPTVQPPPPPPIPPEAYGAADQVRTENARYAELVRQFGQGRQQAQTAYRTQVEQCAKDRACMASAQQTRQQALADIQRRQVAERQAHIEKLKELAEKTRPKRGSPGPRSQPAICTDRSNPLGEWAKIICESNRK